MNARNDGSKGFKDLRQSSPMGAEYVAPRIQTFSAEEFLEVLGPAQGYGGGGSPGSPGGRSGSGRGGNLFPGLRG